ncbi:uncharacterized protein LOC107263623 isoform X2 [Cephus cinctus]|uniref:Uncharacterized protein LOC107263623 isoform X2 n=1 Tax=Cephus cinctus TaxID=211228 RepID=A0AAJ7BHZ3_CEPCN|nr:uncharacterized protein LOC107263623 isoform X2 [Cephus cinctus]
MRKSQELKLGLLLASILVLSVRSAKEDNLIFTKKNNFLNTEKKTITPIHKAALTQRGYIQFLRWELPVPEIDEFTFCLWVKSTNLTYAHSIFSYSKNERDRLVRSWISPFGRSVHLEINNVEVLSHPTVIKEHRWYHICQTWDNINGHYAVWIDGRIEAEGYNGQLVSHVIPSNGDVVVGQEYTDFDKGLEEGVEGFVLGFNLLLASAFDATDNRPSLIINPPLLSLSKLSESEPLLQIGPEFDLSASTGAPIALRRIDENVGVKRGRILHGLTSVTGQGIVDPVSQTPNVFVDPNFNGRFGKFPAKIMNEHEGIFDSTLREYIGEQDESFDKIFHKRDSEGTTNQKKIIAVRINHGSDRSTRTTRATRMRRRGKPLGMQLIDLTYNHCEIGRGSPFIGGPLMLISWTRTPVRVFGGAIMKNAKSECGKF